MPTDSRSQNITAGFWQWLIFGSGSRPGYRHVVDAWLVVHLAIGVMLAAIVDAPLGKVAATSIIPLVGILVGLTFAWVGNANSLLSSKEMDELSDWNPGGIADYVYAYQLAILVTLIALVVWSLVAIVVSDAMESGAQKYALEVVLFAWTSLSVRECWGVVNAAQFMLMARRRVQKLTKLQEEYTKERERK